MSTSQTVPPPDHRARRPAVEVTKTYGTGPAVVTALDRVSVGFGRGRFSAVMGPSGSGKSTLLHCLAGLEPSTRARSISRGDLTGLDERRLTRLRRERVGFIFQSFNLLPTLTVAENIELRWPSPGAGPTGGCWSGWWTRSGCATGCGTGRPSFRGRAAAGRGRPRPGRRPAVVFADEPTGNLDSRSGAELLGFLRRSVDELGQTVVMVTHDPVAAGHSDEVVFLADGRVVDHMAAPTAERVLDRMKALGG